MRANGHKWPLLAYHCCENGGGEQGGLSNVADRERLVSWKRIARYLQRGERTVRRWAAEDGMPVHRVSDRTNSSVYAYSDELDGWLSDRASEVKSSRSPSNQSSRTIVAILPIDNLGVDIVPDEVTEGLTEELISHLGQIPEIGVIARTSVMPFKGTALPIAEVGEQLGAEYVIEGSIRAEANRARVSMQLTNVQDQTHHWASNYEASLQSPIEKVY